MTAHVISDIDVHDQKADYRAAMAIRRGASTGSVVIVEGAD